eukprot:CAMPEP_0177792460 /NCGR_PEP_ID=MMETSP0491_2-20121128/24539_1 /TAXON_ID=63592 /ORGANISM="Tetraselmis chuii, Strain PLY429" /LENGTH=489 /DNA_ID=CAMNT_0019314881 /DNA_START=149 /DNA_END=1618 /DNA_ORIENTATION=-
MQLVRLSAANWKADHLGCVSSAFVRAPSLPVATAVRARPVGAGSVEPPSWKEVRRRKLQAGNRTKGTAGVSRVPNEQGKWGQSDPQPPIADTSKRSCREPPSTPQRRAGMLPTEPASASGESETENSSGFLPASPTASTWEAELKRRAGGGARPPGLRSRRPVAGRIQRRKCRPPDPEDELERLADAEEEEKLWGGEVPSHLKRSEQPLNYKLPKSSPGSSSTRGDWGRREVASSKPGRRKRRVQAVRAGDVALRLRQQADSARSSVVSEKVGLSPRASVGTSERRHPSGHTGKTAVEEAVKEMMDVDMDRLVFPSLSSERRNADEACLGKGEQHWYRLQVHNLSKAKKELNSVRWKVVVPTQRQPSVSRSGRTTWRRVAWEEDRCILILCQLTNDTILQVLACPSVQSFASGHKYTDLVNNVDYFLPRPLVEWEIQEILEFEQLGGGPNGKRTKSEFEKLEAARVELSGFWQHPLCHKGYGTEYKWGS